MNRKVSGRVSLVGAGPGDPELITLRGLRALERADVVLYDRLVSRELLEHARPGVELIHVGKRCGGHSVSQEEINELLVKLAGAGKYVVRLKNGDPFVFGRGGEEVEALAAAGIPHEVIPGVTAALGAGAYCGVPLTVRGLSSSVTLITGHEDPGKGRSDVDWAALARTGSTLVIYMAMAHLEEVVARLTTSGLPEDTPATVVSRATLPEQVSVTAPLAGLPALVRERGLVPPSIMIIGRVVPLHRPAAWFEALPFFGWRVVVAQIHPAEMLVHGLRGSGARVWELPAAVAAPAADTTHLEEIPRRATDELTPQALEVLRQGQADLVVFTDEQCVPTLQAMLAPEDLSSARRVPAAALGSQCAQAARQLGFSVVVGTEDPKVEDLLKRLEDYAAAKRSGKAAVPNAAPVEGPTAAPRHA